MKAVRGAASAWILAAAAYGRPGDIAPDTLPPLPPAHTFPAAEAMEDTVAAKAGPVPDTSASAPGPTSRTAASAPVVRPASSILLPVVSTFIPGFGQLAQRRYAPGLSYAGAAAAGLVLFAENPPPEGAEVLDMEDLMFDRNGARLRFYGIGVLYQGAGFLSAWDVFQASVPALQEKGRFTFLGPRDEFQDLALAPFLPRHFLRPTTWIPLAALGGLMAYAVADYREETRREKPEARWLPFTANDAFFTGTLSLNAGASEEALFRGYLYPLFHQWFGRHFWISNTAQAALFALAHRGTVDIPVVQGLMGWYLGWMTRRNGWSVAQAVALHFWWDVIAVGAALATRNEAPVSLGFSIPFGL